MNQQNPADVSRPRARLAWQRLAAGTALAALTLIAGCGGYGSASRSPFNTPNGIIIADLDGDGAPDLAVATTFVNGATVPPGFTSIILQNRNVPGSFQKGVHYPTGNSPANIAAADLTGSGSIDLVIANFGAGSVSVLLQDSSNSARFQPAIDISTGGAPTDIAVGDLDGDGRPDLAVADGSVSGNVFILLQDPANPGHFLAPTVLSVVNAAAGVAIGDLDGDGKPDIVVTTADVNGNNGRVSIFFQDPAHAGTFLPRVDIPAGAQPGSVKIADLNGDGLPDLAVASFGPGSDGSGSAGVTVLEQDPAHPGSFLAGVTYATFSGAVAVAVGDLNGDGKPDLVVASEAPSGSGSVAVLLQDSARPGVFLSATAYAGLIQPLSVAIGDLNGDGRPDIAVADGDSATVMLQSSTAPGTFAVPVQVGL
jgi:hypothetical protein